MNFREANKKSQLLTMWLLTTFHNSGNDSGRKIVMVDKTF